MELNQFKLPATKASKSSRKSHLPLYFYILLSYQFLFIATLPIGTFDGILASLFGTGNSLFPDLSLSSFSGTKPSVQTWSNVETNINGKKSSSNQYYDSNNPGSSTLDPGLFNGTSLGGIGLPTNLPHSPGNTPTVPGPTSNPNNDSISPYGTPGGEGIGSYHPNDPLGPGRNSKTGNLTQTGNLGPPKDIPSGQSNPNWMNNPTSQPPIDPIQNGGYEPSNNGTNPNNEGGQGGTEGGKEGGGSVDGEDLFHPKNDDGPYDPTDPSGDDDEDC